MRKLIGLLFLLLLCTQTAYANTLDIQKEIDEAEEGAVLKIPAGRYEGSFVIRKRITLQGEQGVEFIAPEGKPALQIAEAQEVTVENIAFSAKEKAIVASDVKGLTLRHLQMDNMHTGIHIQRAKDVHLQHLKITGNAEHYSKKGNGIAIFKSKDVSVENAQIRQVQDGIYIEEVERILIEHNTVENSRYGTHFMYTNHAEARQNTYQYNVTGLMIMMTADLQILHNQVLQHNELNGYGMLLYDVQRTTLAHNTLLNNRTGVALQKSAGILMEQNHFQMNQTALEGTKVDEHTSVTNNQFTGNILTARSDKNGLRLSSNYYDDYTGVDFDGNGIGDTPYVAVSSFGQWMVRQPVYQYFIESPSVVLLTMLDKQINQTEKTILVDNEPHVITREIAENRKDLDVVQFILGLLFTTCSLWLWRRGMR